MEGIKERGLYPTHGSYVSYLMVMKVKIGQKFKTTLKTESTQYF